MRELKFRAWHSGGKYPNEAEMFYDKPSSIFKWLDEGQPLTIMQYTGLKDKKGVEIYEGDIVEYRDLYECHSDAVDYYGVEPQNNFPVSEVYPEVKSGVVEYSMGAFIVNNIDISHLNFLLANKINDCYFMGSLGSSARDFIALCHDLGFSSPIRGNGEVKVIGNIYESPELIGDI